MKKFMMFVMTLAMVAAFVPGAYAAESAQLGLSVTFAVDQDLQRLEELNTHVGLMAEKNKAKFHEIYVDRNNDGVVDGKDLDLNGDGRIDDDDMNILQEAVAYLDGLRAYGESNIDELKSILNRRPDLEDQIVPILNFANEVVIEIIKNIETLKGLEVQPVISIELNNPSWGIQSIHLGDVQENVGPYGIPLHKIANTGTVPVVVDIGYGPTPLADTNGDGTIDNVDVIGFIHPGLRQGLDMFMTAVMMANNAEGSILWQIIPPDNRVKAMRIGPNEAQPLSLSYGAPTKLSGNARGMSATYEIRAYGEITTQ